jgi:hypothetical protein
MGLMIQACSGMGSIAGDQQHRAILLELSARARKISSYAYDFTVQGLRVKRMSFQFEKNGQPFYRFREDLIRSGKRFVYIYNADGVHDYQYYPDEKKAFRCPTGGAWNETNYENARDWHFGYQDGRIIGEDVVLGKSCYLVLLRNNVYAVCKEKGVKLAKKNHPNDKHYAVFYENMEFDLRDDLFRIPADAHLSDREKCDF